MANSVSCSKVHNYPVTSVGDPVVAEVGVGEGGRIRRFVGAGCNLLV